MEHFHNTALLCRGGFSSVSLATHTTGRKCVLKVLENPTPRSLRREQWCLDNLEHRNIVSSGAKLLGLPHPTDSSFVSAGGFTVLWFQYANGGDLFDYIERCVVVQEDLARDLFTQLLAAVAYLHGAGCCHQDIKTENVLLHTCATTGQLVLKLADFGLSSVAALGDDLTHVAQDCGSKRSMAPELHATPDSVDGKAADMWACGTVLFNMLTGYAPCVVAAPTDKSFVQIRDRDYTAFWRKFEKVGPAVSPDAKDLIIGLLKIQPSSRLCAVSASQLPFLRQRQSRPPAAAYTQAFYSAP
jgi:serine/threonine protein kinase